MTASGRERSFAIVTFRLSFPAAARIDHNEPMLHAPQVRAVAAGCVRADLTATVGSAANGVVLIALLRYVVSLCLFGGWQT